MLDLILAAVMAAMFYGGFRCGNKFATLRDVWAAAKTMLP